MTMKTTISTAESQSTSNRVKALSAAHASRSARGDQPPSGNLLYVARTVTALRLFTLRGRHRSEVQRSVINR